MLLYFLNITLLLETFIKTTQFFFSILNKFAMIDKITQITNDKTLSLSKKAK